ncbi:L-ascorbate oxidase-like [Corylus avellana]|uniref:L-ascorbate oxidase-like n=1 Tax=Corylus avellana TaxID=13451 RepID=UPI00286BDD9D|nr:L-ascorbate oxidase-like [Corylus avellana]
MVETLPFRSCMFLLAFFLISLITVRLYAYKYAYAYTFATFKYKSPDSAAKNNFSQWEVKYAYKSPDCFKKLAMTINGESPGPTIYAQQGDTIVVNLTNSLPTENVALHWHGIRQIGTPWSDGTEGVTQCPIMPGDTFTYKFVVDRAGTYLYHAHYGLQISAGLYGFIIVSVPDGVPEPFVYDHDRSIILNDWYHASTYEQATGLSSIDYRWVGEPQSLLINGRGRFNCSELAQSRAIKAHHDFVDKPPPRSDRVIVLLNTQNLIDGYHRWSLNNRSLVLPHTPYLIALKENFIDAFDQNPPPDSYDIHNYDIFSVPDNVNATSSNAIYRISFNTTVDIILQNANTMIPNHSETHPWHMHGHDFWVLGYGMNKFDKEKDPATYNLDDPIMKNTVPLYPYGWTALRFRVDNPGVWIFHCHIEPHLFMGMGIVFEAGVEMVGTLPTSIMGCVRS